MGKRKGFITIIVMIVMSLSLIMLLYILDVSKLQSLMTFHSRDHVQSLYNCESKVLLCLKDKDYIDNKLNPILFNYFRTSKIGSNGYINIDPTDLDNGDLEGKVDVDFKSIKGKKHIELIAKSNVKGNVTNAKATASLVNEIYEERIPIIDLKMMEEYLKGDKLNKIGELVHQIEDSININALGKNRDIYAFQTDQYKQMNLKAKKLICTRDSIVAPYTEFFNTREVFIVCKKHSNGNIDFYIDEINNKRVLNGILYVEGDLHVNTNFKFGGMIIINGGKLVVEESKKFRIEGMLVYINNNEKINTPDNVDITYRPGVIYKYGIYLPGFLDIKLKSMKLY